ncbi:DUF6042 family protein, partial [Streptomyces zinciresistens]
MFTDRFGVTWVKPGVGTRGSASRTTVRTLRAPIVLEEELRMTDTPSVPGPRRDLAMHNDWWASGWDHVLPRQGFPLTMLIGTASQPGFTGSLDELLQELFEGHWDMIGGDLDGTLTFSWPDEEWDCEEAPEGREANEAHRWEKFGAMLMAAGYPVPKTVRDLSELYLTWG